MPIRTFTAPDGSLWQVWEVRPTAGEGAYSPPRVWERRGQDLYKGPERRQGERRRSPPPSSLTPPGHAGGWLVLESGTEKWRLSPPPPDWETYSDERLRELWRRARGRTEFPQAG